MEQVVFDRRFRGPPESANGGYSCGVAAGLIGEPASVRLLRPPPLGRPLDVDRRDGRVVLLADGESVVEAARSAWPIADAPEPVTLDQARRASERYIGFATHAFPSCFVCGTERAVDDGLRIFPGPVEGRTVLAAPWTPGANLADGNGFVRPEFVWASLDCPGGWASWVETGERLSLLGTLSVRRFREIAIGETCVVMAWPMGSEGRKSYAGTAVLSDAGELLAVGNATWIECKDLPGS